MTHYNWDEALGAEGLLALTEEAVAARRRGRAPLRRLAALAACAGLVLGLMNYQALAAGAERVFRYFLGVGAAEQEESLLIQGESLSAENRETLFLIEGAYQRDGLLTLPLDVLSRSEAPGQVWDRQKFRISVYGAGGEELTHVMRTSEGEVVELAGVAGVGRIDRLDPLENSLSWLKQAYLPQGYASAASRVFVMKVPRGEMGPYTFRVEAYSVSGGWGEVLWSGTLELDTPRAVDVTQASREIGVGTVTALVGAEGQSVAFYGELNPRHTGDGDRLVQLSVPQVWFVDEAGNRYEGYMRRYAASEEYLPELRLAGEPEGRIVAIEVTGVEYNIFHGDGEGQSHPVYDSLSWVIELPG